MSVLDRSCTVLLLGCLTACTTGGGWRTRPLAPQDAKRTTYTGSIGIVTTDGQVHRFRSLWVSADSVGGPSEPEGAERALPIGAVTEVRERTPRRTSGVLTGFTIGAVIGGIGGAGVGVAAAHFCLWGNCPEPSNGQVAAAAIAGAAAGGLVLGAAGALIGLGVDAVPR